MIRISDISMPLPHRDRCGPWHHQRLSKNQTLKHNKKALANTVQCHIGCNYTHGI